MKIIKNNDCFQAVGKTLNLAQHCISDGILRLHVAESSWQAKCIIKQETRFDDKNGGRKRREKSKTKKKLSIDGKQGATCVDPKRAEHRSEFILGNYMKHSTSQTKDDDEGN